MGGGSKSKNADPVNLSGFVLEDMDLFGLGINITVFERGWVGGPGGGGLVHLPISL